MIKEEYLQSTDITDFTFEIEGFDINQAFQVAFSGVISDEELALQDKVLRMEFILAEASNELYHEFIDFRTMAEQVEFFCNHNHDAEQLVHDSEDLSSLIDIFKGPEKKAQKYKKRRIIRGFNLYMISE